MSEITETVPETTPTSGKMVKVTLVKSPIRSRHNHRDTIRSLGLTKINTSKVLPDNPAIRGMIHSVSQWIKVEEAQ